MKIGISLARQYALPIEQVICLVQKAGFAAVSPLWGTNVNMQAVCTLARQAGLDIQSMHAPFGKTDILWSDDPTVSAPGLNIIMTALDDCIACRIPIMVMHAWIDNGRPLTPTYFANFDAIVEKANAAGVKVAFENTEGEQYLFALLEHYQDNPMVGFCWDSGHEKCYNHDMDLLAKFGNRLLITHLNDNLGISDPGGEITYLDDLHLLPGDGVIDWERNTQRLNRCAPLPYLNFELNLVSKPGRNENDVYAQMPLADYFRLAYQKATQATKEYAL